MRYCMSVLPLCAVFEKSNQQYTQEELKSLRFSGIRVVCNSSGGFCHS